MQWVWYLGTMVALYVGSKLVIAKQQSMQVTAEEQQAQDRRAEIAKLDGVAEDANHDDPGHKGVKLTSKKEPSPSDSDDDETERWKYWKSVGTGVAQGAVAPETFGSMAAMASIASVTGGAALGSAVMPLFVAGVAGNFAKQAKTDYKIPDSEAVEYTKIVADATGQLNEDMHTQVDNWTSTQFGNSYAVQAVSSAATFVPDTVLAGVQGVFNLEEVAVDALAMGLTPATPIDTKPVTGVDDKKFDNAMKIAASKTSDWVLPETEAEFDARIGEQGKGSNTYNAWQAWQASQ